MVDDHRRREPGQRGAEGETPASADTVALPEHASAYFSPRSPPTSTAHQTLETEAIRLDPAIDPDNAVTQQVRVEGLQPPPWLGQQPLRSDAPTVLVPLVRARRRRTRALAAVVAALVGVVVGIGYGVTRPISPRQPADSASPAVRLPEPPASRPAATSSAGGVETPSTAEPAIAAPGASAAAAPSSEKSTQLASHSSPIGRAQAATRRARPVSSAPSAWLKSEPPKAWFK